MKKNMFTRVLVITTILTLAAGGAAVFAHETGANVSVTVDGQPAGFSRPGLVDGADVYVSADDVFNYYGFNKQTDSTNGVTAYISPDKFFTVSHETLAVKINGVPSAVSFKSVGQQWFVKASDLARIIPVTSAYDQAAGELRLTTGWNSEIVVHLDHIMAFVPKGSFKISDNQLWIGIYTLPNILLESDVLVNAGNLEIHSPIDGSYTKINFNGTVEYRAAGAQQSAVAYYDKAAMLNDSGDSLRLRADLISRYSSYDITMTYTPSAAKSLFDIRVKSAWNDSRRAGSGVVTLSDPAVPAGNAGLDAAAGADTHPSVKDSGYVLNMALMDEAAAEINRYRVNAGLSPLTVNHSLVYTKQNDMPGRTTAFDNLRWCREYLSGRTLEHILPAPYMGEILMAEFKTGTSAAMIVNLWNSSPVHKAIIMNPNQREFGICVIQYPNEDMDVVGVFLEDHS